MHTLQRLAATALFSTLAGFAAAQEAVQDSTWITPSTAPRAQVRLEALAAVQADSIPRSEASAGPAPMASASPQARAQARAEAREAMRLGLLPIQEGGVRDATPAERERIRQAGLRALEMQPRVAAR